MNIKRVISMAAVASLSLSMLASCGSSDSSSDSGKTGGDKVKLTVYTNRTDRIADGGDGSLEKKTKAFEDANNCEVQYVGFTDYDGDMSKKLSGSDYGDVLCIPDAVALKELGNFFEPLGSYDELSKKYRWADKKMYDKTVYGIATGGAAKGVLYNTKVWSDAGITELPKTPEDFIADLKLIKEKTDAIPYYTQFADASWTLNQWSDLILSAAGNANYKIDLLQNKSDLFDKDGGYYKVFKLMYNLFSTKEIIEEDPTTSQWEASKEWMGEGKIGTMVMGSWAVSQFQEKAQNKDDIGYMPAPFTAADGKQYAQTAGDYCMGVSKNSKNKDLAKKFVEWFALDSGFAASEGMISTAVDSELPDNLSNFKDCVLIEEAVAPDDLQGKFDDIDKGSELGTFDGDAANFKIKLAEAAFAGKGDSEFKAITDECNTKWATKRDEILK